MTHHDDHQHTDHHAHDSSGGGARFGRPFGRSGRPGPGFPGFGPGGAGFPGFPGFGPGGPHRGGRGRARRGDVRLAILSLLSDAPSNGYGLIKAIAERTDGVWKPSPGSVYPTLQQLVDEGFIVDGVETATDAKGEYSLTEAGRAYVAEQSEAIDAAWAATADDGQGDEFRESLGKLFGAVQQFRTGVTDAQRAAATAKLDETRRALYAILAD